MLRAALRYVDVYCRKFPVDTAFIKAHLFKMTHHSLDAFPEMRAALGDMECRKSTLEHFVSWVRTLMALEVERGVEGPNVKKVKEKKVAAAAGAAMTPSESNIDVTVEGGNAGHNGDDGCVACVESAEATMKRARSGEDPTMDDERAKRRREDDCATTVVC